MSRHLLHRCSTHLCVPAGGPNDRDGFMLCHVVLVGNDLSELRANLCRSSRKERIF